MAMRCTPVVTLGRLDSDVSPARSTRAGLLIPASQDDVDSVFNRAERNNRGQRIAHGVFEDDDGFRRDPWRGQCAVSLPIACNMALRVWRISTAAKELRARRPAGSSSAAIARNLERTDVARGWQPAQVHREQEDQ